MVVSAPAVGTLAAGVAAVELGTTGTSCAMGGAVAHRAPPRLDDVVGNVGTRSGWSIDGHEWSVVKGCDGDSASARRRTGARGRNRSPQRGRSPPADSGTPTDLIDDLRRVVNRPTGPSCPARRVVNRLTGATCPARRVVNRLTGATCPARRVVNRLTG